MKVEVEVADDGTLTDDHLKALPDALKSYLTSASDRGFKEGYAKGMSTKARELQPHLVDPVERERQQQAMQELEQRRIKDAESEKRYQEALQMRETQHKTELDKAREQVTLRDVKLRAAIGAEIKAAAVQAGARDESIPELVKILGGEVDLTEALEPYVKGADGKPAVDAKHQPLTIEGRVRAYLDVNRHHLRVNPGKSGDARGGASYAHLSSEAQSAATVVEAAQERIRAGDHSDAAVAQLFEAQRALRAASAQR